MPPKKFDYQHYILLVTLFVTTVGPSTVQFLTGSGLSTAAKTVSGILALVTGILSLLKQFNPSYTQFKMRSKMTDPPSKN